MNNWKLSDLIGDFEEPELFTGNKKNLPIKVNNNSEWQRKSDPTRMVRIFKLEDESKFNAFVLSILEYQAETGHHGRITMQFPQVKIEVWTHTLMDITEIDIEYTKKVTDIFGDYS